MSALYTCRVLSFFVLSLLLSFSGITDIFIHNPYYLFKIRGLSIVCMVYPQDASQLLTAGRASITSMFTWMYVGANQFAIMIFILYTAVRYGHIKLGTKQSLPEFSDVEYFAMLFSAGVGVGVRCCCVGCLFVVWESRFVFFLKHGGIIVLRTRCAPQTLSTRTTQPSRSFSLLSNDSNKHIYIYCKSCSFMV